MSVAFGLVGFALYFRSIFRGDTKPHVFTWASFALIDGIVFAAQVLKGAGPGAWATALGTVMCAVVALTALRVGHVRITRSDWVAFVGAIVGIALWAATNDPLWAVVLASAVNMISLYPTVRKSYVAPSTESVSVWSIDIFRYLFSLFALQSFTLTTALFPAAIVVGNGIVVATVLVRRHVLA
jgi:hypothetical protein